MRVIFANFYISCCLSFVLVFSVLQLLVCLSLFFDNLFSYFKTPRVRPSLPGTKFEIHPRSMFSGAGDACSRRRWTSSLLLFTAHILYFMVHCSVCLLPVRFRWNLEGRRSRLTLRQRRFFVVLLSVILLLRLVPPPVMSREGSLTAALLWSSGSDPVVPSSGCRRTRDGVVSVKIFQPLMELRSKSTSSTSPSPGRLESNKPPSGAPPHITGTRSKHITNSDPNLFGNASASLSFKVILLRHSSSGDHSFGADERTASWSVLARLEISSGISPRYILTYLFFGKNLPVGSPDKTLFRLSSSSEATFLPPCPLPVARGVFSGLFPNACFSSFIVLSSCGAVSTGPEDASKITSVIFVDGVWTSTSHYVTILKLFDFVVKAHPTHSSIVSNSLSSPCEDLSYLAYVYVFGYAYCLREWIIPSCYCIKEV
ncbi:BnaC04g29250D [Brassica napus]|uniref:BnaC04g29250D protein n=1 Tax=Brassica napus TaxID=3708 RepID=A0A078FHN1_BRANA|nr:BnaC04g29250D [Brassica napus]